MRKNKEYISDVQQKIIELHKLVKWAKAVKIPISTIKENNWEGEFEWLKTLQRPQLENCREVLSLGVRKP